MFNLEAAGPLNIFYQTTLSVAASESKSITDLTSLIEDDVAGCGSIEDYQTNQYLQGLDQGQLNALGAQLIIDNLAYYLPDLSTHRTTTNLYIIPDKLSLTTARDELEFLITDELYAKYVKLNHPDRPVDPEHLNSEQVALLREHDFTPNEILVLLYSLTATPPPPVSTPADNTTISYQVMDNLGRFIPTDQRVTVLQAQDGASGHFAVDMETGANTIFIGAETNNAEALTAHEYGHNIYRYYSENEPAVTAAWGQLYTEYQADYGTNILNGPPAFELLDDSNYVAGLSDKFGHPNANADELFASMCSAYYANPEQFLAYINDPDTPAQTREFGIKAWIFMRDTVFAGEVFLPNGLTDPLAAVTI